MTINHHYFNNTSDDRGGSFIMNQYIETCIAEQEFTTAITLCEYCLKEMTMEQYYQEGINEWLDDKKKGKNAFVRGLDWIIKALPRAIRAFIRFIKGLFKKTKTPDQAKQVFDNMDVPDQPEQTEPEQPEQRSNPPEKKPLSLEEKMSDICNDMTESVLKHLKENVRLVQRHTLPREEVVFESTVEKLVTKMVHEKQLILLCRPSDVYESIGKIKNAINDVEMLTELDIKRNPQGVVDKTVATLQKSCKSLQDAFQKSGDVQGFYPQNKPNAIKGSAYRKDASWNNITYISPENYKKTYTDLEGMCVVLEDKCEHILDSFNKEGSFFNSVAKEANGIYNKKYNEALSKEHKSMIFDGEKFKSNFDNTNHHAKNKQAIEDSLNVFKMSQSFLDQLHLDIVDSEFINRTCINSLKKYAQVSNICDRQYKNCRHVESTRNNGTVEPHGLFYHYQDDPGTYKSTKGNKQMTKKNRGEKW